MDFNNRQLAEIISQTAEKINSNVLKERKIANDIEATSTKIENHLANFSKQILQLQKTSIKPDLSDLNKFYEEKTEENIKRLNSRLNVPNLAVFVWLGSVLLFFCSGAFIYFATKSKQEILTEYRQELTKEGKVIISKENNDLFNDMYQWFEKNPKTRDTFIQSSKRNK
jgi:hypothetical protein